MSTEIAWDAAAASDLIALNAHRPGALLPVLHAIQDRFGYVAEAVLPEIATALAVSRADVQSVISLYGEFRTTPPGTHRLKLCRAEACQAMGGERLAEAVVDRLGVDWGGTTRDGHITIEGVSCLGLCACAPAASMDGQPIGRLTGDKLDRLLADCSP